jgi:hypothetical protein
VTTGQKRKMDDITINNSRSTDSLYKDDEYEMLVRNAQNRLDHHEGILCMVCFQSHGTATCLLPTHSSITGSPTGTKRQIKDVSKNQKKLEKGEEEEDDESIVDDDATLYCPNCGCPSHHCDYPPLDGRSYNLCNAPKYEAYNRFNKCERKSIFIMFYIALYIK